jgi:hypothetical protein
MLQKPASLADAGLAVPSPFLLKSNFHPVCGCLVSKDSAPNPEGKKENDEKRNVYRI